MTKKDQKDFYRRVGERVRSRRRELKMTQLDVATALGVQQSVIAKIESAHLRMPMHAVAEMSSILKMPIADFLLAMWEVTC